MADRVGVFTESTAKLVLQVINELVRQGYAIKSGQGGPDRWQRNNGIIAKTPAGGIAARSGTTCYSESCEVYRINDSDTLVNVLDNDGNNLSVDVYHMGSSAVQGSVYIQAKYVYGKWVADMEDCG